jgi:hypothetical protein
MLCVSKLKVAYVSWRISKYRHFCNDNVRWKLHKKDNLNIMFVLLTSCASGCVSSAVVGWLAWSLPSWSDSVGVACVVAAEVGDTPGLGRPPILIFGPGRSGRGPPPMFIRLLKCSEHYALD